MAHNLVKEWLTQPYLAFPQSRLIGLFGIPPKLTLICDGRGNELLTILFFVDQGLR